MFAYVLVWTSGVKASVCTGTAPSFDEYNKLLPLGVRANGPCCGFSSKIDRGMAGVCVRSSHHTPYCTASLLPRSSVSNSVVLACGPTPLAKEKMRKQGQSKAGCS